MKKFFAMILALAMMIACFSACGANSDTVGSDNPSKTIVVGYTIYAPMNYFNENNLLVGFDTELATMVFENLGYKVMFQEIDWTSKYTDLASGTIDCVWNGFTSNTTDSDGIARSEKVDFSYSYMENRQVVVVREDSGILSSDDLAEKLGAYEAGSAGEEYAKSFQGAFTKDFTKQTDCLLEVNACSADFAVVDLQLARSYVGKGDYQELIMLEELSSEMEYYAIGFVKGSELTAQVNAQLEALAASGALQELADKYGLGDTVITDFTDQK